MTGYVLDAFAILVWIFDQEGANAVQQLLEQASAGAISLTMSMINAGEVRYMLAKKKGAPAAEQYEQQMLSLRELDRLAVAQHQATDGLRGRYSLAGRAPP